MSAYNDFVRKHMPTAKGSTPAERMRNVAAMWRKQKGKGVAEAEPQDGGCCKGEGVRRRKHAPSKLAGGSGKRTGHALATSDGGALFKGGMVDMRPANEVGVQNGQGFKLSSIFPPAAIFGLGIDEDEMEGDGINFKDIMGGIGTVAKTAASIAPLAMMLL